MILYICIIILAISTLALSFTLSTLDSKIQLLETKLGLYIELNKRN